MTRAVRFLLVLAALPIAVVLAEYLCSPIYRFPAPRPFVGKDWYNPYETPIPRWQKCNFHAHSRSWGGLTDGKQSAEEIRDAYRALDYDVIAIANYHAIEGGPLPAYESGYSIFKTHLLGIGARAVQWFDFPLMQSRHQKQYVIDRVRPDVELLAIAHPSVRGGYSIDDLSVLGNYQLVEAISPFGDSLAEWDSALSSGHAVWILGSDDVHDLSRRERVGSCFTLVGAPSAEPKAIYDALRAGRHVAVRGQQGAVENNLQSVRVSGDSVTVILTAPASRIVFVGQDGRRLATVANASTATYAARPNDPYVRIEAVTGKSTMFLNPLIRWDGSTLPAPSPTLDLAATWALRAGLAAVYGLLAWRLVRVVKRK